MIYAADGQPIVQVMIHYLPQLALRDADGDRQPDAGEAILGVEDLPITCR